MRVLIPVFSLETVSQAFGRSDVGFRLKTVIDLGVCYKKTGFGGLFSTLIIWDLTTVFQGMKKCLTTVV